MGLGISGRNSGKQSKPKESAISHVHNGRELRTIARGFNDVVDLDSSGQGELLVHPARENLALESGQGRSVTCSRILKAPCRQIAYFSQSLDADMLRADFSRYLRRRTEYCSQPEAIERLRRCRHSLSSVSPFLSSLSTPKDGDGSQLRFFLQIRASVASSLADHSVASFK